MDHKTHTKSKFLHQSRALHASSGAHPMPVLLRTLPWALMLFLKHADMPLPRHFTALHLLPFSPGSCMTFSLPHHLSFNDSSVRLPLIIFKISTTTPTSPQVVSIPLPCFSAEWLPPSNAPHTCVFWFFIYPSLGGKCWRTGDFWLWCCCVPSLAHSGPMCIFWRNKPILSIGVYFLPGFGATAK